MAGLEPAGDLLRCPSFGEAITDEVPQPAIPFEDGFTPSAPLIGSGGVERRIAATGQGVSAQLPRHGGFGPPHRQRGRAAQVISRALRAIWKTAPSESSCPDPICQALSRTRTGLDQCCGSLWAGVMDDRGAS